MSASASSHFADPREILVIKPSSLGDIVHALPAVALLKRRWPEARLRWLINSEWAPLLEGHPDIDEIVEFPRRQFRGVRGALRIAPWAQELRERMSADLVVDLQGLLRSALLARLSCAPGGRIIGPSDAREGARLLYDEAPDVSAPLHAVRKCLALVEGLGIALPPDPELSFRLPVGKPPAGITLPARFVALHPFSRGVGKSLTAAEVEAFCRTLAPTPVVVLGVSDIAAPALPHVVDLLGQTSLAELIYVLRQANFVVSVDSGPMHIAAALTSRLLSLHRWSDPLRVGPFDPEAWVWKDDYICRVKDLTNENPRACARTMESVAEWVRERVE